MKIMTFLMISSVVACGTGVAFADDSVSRATPNTHQMMKDCIRKQKTADVTMSKSAMNRICKDEIKRQQATGSMPAPPTDVPHDP